MTARASLIGHIETREMNPLPKCCEDPEEASNKFASYIPNWPSSVCHLHARYKNFFAKSSSKHATAARDWNSWRWCKLGDDHYRDLVPFVNQLLRPCAVVHLLYFLISSWPLPWTWRSYLTWHLLCPFGFESLQSLIALVFHNSSLFEVLDLHHNRVSEYIPGVHSSRCSAFHVLQSILSSQWRKLTQLVAQLLSNPLLSAAHAFSALSFSVILSMISALSKHLK